LAISGQSSSIPLSVPAFERLNISQEEEQAFTPARPVFFEDDLELPSVMPTMVDMALPEVLPSAEDVRSLPTAQEAREPAESKTQSFSPVRALPEMGVSNQDAIFKIAFGKAKWERFFGDVGVEPPITQEIVEALKSPCPYWGEKRIEETHMLVLIPQTVNGRPLTLNTLQELIQSPQGEGHATKYRYYYDRMQKEIGSQPVSSSYWALMTKDVLPNSRNKTYIEQQALIKGPYAIPGALEMATGLLMHHAQTGERLYPETFTRCQEKLSNTCRVVVGSFGSSGLSVIRNDDRRDVCSGLGGLRKF